MWRYEWAVGSFSDRSLAHDAIDGLRSPKPQRRDRLVEDAQFSLAAQRFGDGLFLRFTLVPRVPLGTYSAKAPAVALIEWP